MFQLLGLFQVFVCRYLSAIHQLVNLPHNLWVLWWGSSLAQAKPSLQLLGNSCVCSSVVPVIGRSHLYLLFILTIIMWYNWTQSLQHLKDFTQLPLLHLLAAFLTNVCAVLLRLKGDLSSQLWLILCILGLFWSCEWKPSCKRSRDLVQQMIL